MTVMLLEWVFTSIFLILVVLALRFLLGKRIGAGLRYARWAVVLVRLLIPVQLFTSPVAGTWVITEKRTEQTVYTPVNRGEQFHPVAPAHKRPAFFLWFWLLVADLIVLTIYGKLPPTGVNAYIGFVASIAFLGLFVLLPIITALENRNAGGRS